MTLRDVIGQTYMHRERARYALGTSDVLGITFAAQPSDGFIIRCDALPELTDIRVARTGTTIGAFAALEAVSARAPEIVPPGTSASAARLRLSLLDVTVTIVGGGRTRTAPLDALALAAHELPISIEVPPLRAGLGFGDRHRRTTDGAASHVVGISVALRASALGRFEAVRIVVDFEGVLVRASLAEAKLEKQRLDPGLFPEAARLAAYAVEAGDARTSAAARSITPLAMAALRDAYAAARPREESPMRRPRSPKSGKRRLF